MMLHIQEVFKTSTKQDQKRISLHIIIKTKHTEQSKYTESRKGKSITTAPDYSANTLEEGKE